MMIINKMLFKILENSYASQVLTKFIHIVIKQMLIGQHVCFFFQNKKCTAHKNITAFNSLNIAKLTRHKKCKE